MAPNIEIVEAQLPEPRQRIRMAAEAERQLPGRGPMPLAQPDRDALLEDLHACGRGAARGFPDEQVDVFGHDHIADKGEAVAVADFAKNFREGVLGPR